MTGLFIVFEGGDGVGKSTQVRHLSEWLREQGQQVLVTHEPGDTEVGLKLRQIVLDPATGHIDPRAEALLLAADKAQHLHELVRPALASGTVVVCDRYVDSMIAYQGAGRELEAEDVAHLAHWATAGLVPDLTILMDVEPAQAVHQKTDRDRLEDAGAAFHQRVREGFLACAEAAPERYLVLHARDELATNVAAVRARVAELIDA
ncbi:MAG: dTMP kinase [Propionibacteriaceae bacterium]|nr:dTMP kinase [Propionibacteriaceae bacterium]